MAELDPLPTYQIHVQRLDPILADLRIEFAGLPPDVEVRGRLMGPRCQGVSTVEIAYPLRAVTGSVYQVLVPDPTYWSENRPFVYDGPVEFRRGGHPVGKLTLSFAFKVGP